jgi:PadR family transcriptional regulator AphA
MASEHVILGVIARRPCSGYDIKAELEQGCGPLLSSLNFGSIYPSLKKLGDEGLVRMEQEGAAGRPRKVHELTARGWEALTVWLETPTDYPIPMRDELLLKMLFWGAALPHRRAALIAHLQRRREHTVELLAYLAEWLADEVSSVDEYSLLVRDYLRGRLEAEFAWIHHAIAQFEGPPRSPAGDQRARASQREA